MICARMAELGTAYGDLDAHDGLWAAAIATSDDIAARLAIAPLVLEARGLDVTPGMIERLRKAGDAQSAAAMTVIYNEEIGHVAAGRRWLEHVCVQRGEDTVETFHRLVHERFRRFETAGERAGTYPSGTRAGFLRGTASVTIC